MIFCVSPDPYHEMHGSSPERVKRLFHELKNIGIGGINVSYENPDEHPEWVDYISNVAERAREFGFRVSMHAPAADISSVDDATRGSAIARVGKSIRDIGQLMDGVIVVVHPENYRPDRQPGDDDARKHNCRKSLDELVRPAAQYDVRIAIENMRWRPDNPNRTGMYTDHLTEIIDGMDERAVGICFDVGHANISEGDDLEGAFSRNAHRIIHIHLADNFGIEDDHFQPGEGAINFESFYKAVKASGYTGMAQLEVKMKEGDDPIQFYLRNYQHFIRTARLR
jgi:sugar phosphate isomerase/epimerase